MFSFTILKDGDNCPISRLPSDLGDMQDVASTLRDFEPPENCWRHLNAIHQCGISLSRINRALERQGRCSGGIFRRTMRRYIGSREQSFRFDQLTCQKFSSVGKFIRALQQRSVSSCFDGPKTIGNDGWLSGRWLRMIRVMGEATPPGFASRVCDRALRLPVCSLGGRTVVVGAKVEGRG